MELLMQGIVLVVIGMVTVFCFLGLLIQLMNLSAAFFRKFSHLFPEEAQVAKKGAADPVAEIAVALAVIRAKRG